VPLYPYGIVTIPVYWQKSFAVYVGGVKDDLVFWFNLLVLAFINRVISQFSGIFRISVRNRFCYSNQSRGEYTGDSCE
jgi:hypothetical protein